MYCIGEHLRLLRGVLFRGEEQSIKSHTVVGLASVLEFIDHDWWDKVNSGIGLSTLSPSQGSMNFAIGHKINIIKF
jgi:hypothetical protein